MAVSVFSFVGWCTCGQLPIDAKDSAQRDVEARSKKQKGKPREKQLERFFSENTRTHVSSKVQVVPNSIPSRLRVARGRKKGDRVVSAAAADAAAEDCVLNASFFFYESLEAGRSVEVGVFFLERQEMDFDIPVFLSLSLSLSRDRSVRLFRRAKC